MCDLLIVCPFNKMEYAQRLAGKIEDFLFGKEIAVEPWRSSHVARSKINTSTAHRRKLEDSRAIIVVISGIDRTSFPIEEIITRAAQMEIPVFAVDSRENIPEEDIANLKAQFHFYERPLPPRQLSSEFIEALREVIEENAYQNSENPKGLANEWETVIERLLQFFPTLSHACQQELIVRIAQLGAPAIQAFRKLLLSPDEEKFMLAIGGFSLLGDAAVEPLLEIMETYRGPDSARVRMLAATALSVLDDIAAERLLELLRGEDKQGSELAAWVLGRIRDERAVDRLIQLLTDASSSTTLRAFAAMVLGRIGAEASEGALSALLMDDNTLSESSLWLIQVSLARILVRKGDLGGARRVLGLAGAFPDAFSIDFILGKISQDDDEQWTGAVGYFVILGERAIDPLLDLLISKPELWYRIGFAFAFIGASAVPALIHALAKESSDVTRAYIAEIIGDIGEPAVPKMLTVAQKKKLWGNVWVRRGIVWALGWIQDEQAIPLLTRCLRDEDVAVKMYATQALKRFGITFDKGSLPAL